ncbi:MAG: hypothetical protein GXO73_05055 [Calditrichaeota bacterium]|nr:hypothetical protein [Calditrichota bacterium]
MRHMSEPFRLFLTVLSFSLFSTGMPIQAVGSQPDSVYYQVMVFCDDDSLVRGSSGGQCAVGEVFQAHTYHYGQECLGTGIGGDDWLTGFARRRNLPRNLPETFRKNAPSLVPSKAPKEACNLLFSPVRARNGVYEVHTVLCIFHLQGGMKNRLHYSTTVVDTVFVVPPGHTVRVAQLRGDCPRTYSVYLRLDETRPPPVNELTTDFQMLEDIQPLTLPVNFYLRYEQRDSTGTLCLLQTTKQINFDLQHPFVLRFLTPPPDTEEELKSWPEYRILGYVVPVERAGDSLKCVLLLQQALGTEGHFGAKVFIRRQITLTRGEPLRVILLGTHLGIGVPTVSGKQELVTLEQLLKGRREELYITAYF